MTKTSSKTGGAFVPMSEKEMTSVKGGTGIPDWLNDLVDQFNELTHIIDDYLNLDQGTVSDDYWDTVEDELIEQGYVPYTPEQINEDW